MAERKYMGFDSLATYDALIKAFVNGKIFIGTYAEYQAAYTNQEIAIGALVIITDDENNSSSGGNTPGDSASTTSVLGTAILGQMILA